MRVSLRQILWHGGGSLISKRDGRKNCESREMEEMCIRQCTTFNRSPRFEVSRFVFQLFFLFSRFFIISAQPSSSSSSSSAAAACRRLLALIEKPALETGRAVTDGAEDLTSEMLDLWFSSFHGFDIGGTNEGPCSGCTADIGRYRGLAPMLLCSDGAIDDA